MRLVAANAAVLGWTFAGGRARRTTAALAVTAVLVLPGWWLVNAGLEPVVGRGRHPFPAIGFLLSPDRTTPASQTDLLLRWALVQTAGRLVLAWSGAAAVTLAGQGRRRVSAGVPATAPAGVVTPSRAAASTT